MESVLMGTDCPQIPSAYLAISGIQREAKQNTYSSIQISTSVIGAEVRGGPGLADGMYGAIHHAGHGPALPAALGGVRRRSVFPALTKGRYAFKNYAYFFCCFGLWQRLITLKNVYRYAKYR